MRIVNVTKVDPLGVEYDITVDTGFWWFKRTRTFRGISTIWRDLRTGERAGTFLEGALADICWLNKQGPLGERA